MLVRKREMIAEKRRPRRKISGSGPEQTSISTRNSLQEPCENSLDYADQRQYNYYSYNRC